MSVIRTLSVSKRYDHGHVPVQALLDVSIDIGQGEFTAIVGPSGSGKTTLLNILGGLDEPTAGQVMVRGTDLFSLNEKERIRFRLHHIGFVFQAYNLIPVLTAKENVAFTLQIQGRPKADIEKRSLDLLDAVGLADKADQRPGELSGGQQQRVAVARALASTPDFVLADEPTANLDSKSAATLLDIMERLNREHGVTFLFSTHDQRVVDRARRILTLVDGEVASDILKP